MKRNRGIDENGTMVRNIRKQRCLHRSMNCLTVVNRGTITAVVTRQFWLNRKSKSKTVCDSEFRGGDSVLISAASSTLELLYHRSQHLRVTRKYTFNFFFNFLPKKIWFLYFIILRSKKVIFQNRTVRNQPLNELKKRWSVEQTLSFLET